MVVEHLVSYEAAELEHFELARGRLARKPHECADDNLAARRVETVDGARDLALDCIIFVRLGVDVELHPADRNRTGRMQLSRPGHIEVAHRRH